MKNFLIFLAFASACAGARSAIDRHYMSVTYCGPDWGEDYADMNCRANPKTMDCGPATDTQKVKEFWNTVDRGRQQRDVDTYCGMANHNAVERECKNDGGTFYKGYGGLRPVRFAEFNYYCVENPAKRECQSKAEDGAVWDGGKCKQRNCDECGCFNAYVERGVGITEYDGRDGKKRYECCKDGGAWQGNKCVRAAGENSNGTAGAGRNAADETESESSVDDESAETSDKSSGRTAAASHPNASDGAEPNDDEKEFLRQINELTAAFHKRIMELTGE